MPDYENDLAFKPPMSWADLKRYAREKGGVAKESIYICKLEFDEDGGIYLDPFYLGADEENFCIASDVSYERMKTIIEALWG